jgi:hypothetical protein
VLHIQEAPILHSLKRDLPDSTDEQQPRKIPKREQPQNIRLRFRPVGVVGGDLGDIGDETIDVEMHEAPLDSTPRKEKRSQEEKEKRRKEKGAKKTFNMPTPVATPFSKQKDLPGIKPLEVPKAVTSTEKKKKKKDKSKEKTKSKD